MILVNGKGKVHFQLGVDLDGNPVIGIDHPDLNASLFITGPVLANINGWIARRRKDLKPIIID